MLTLFIWLSSFLLTVLAFGFSFPEDTLRIGRKIKRQLRERYAKRHGQAAAEKHLPIQPWEFDP